MGIWKPEYKNNLWLKCMQYGHNPVVVGFGSGGISLYCSECRKVWRIGVTSNLCSVSEDALALADDCRWKRKVLELMEGCS
jgi:hypothetical protein